MDRDYSEQLARQLRFIARSCESYDRGAHDEAVRIATVIRVLFHDTSNSKSLLSLLRAQHVRLLSTVLLVSNQTVFFDGMSVTTVCDGAMNVGPGFDRTGTSELMGRAAWWNQLVYISGGVRISRRDVVLTAANKDGGAHVDPKLTPEYELLKQGLWTISSGPDKHERVEDAQFGFLRQMGYELLNSPELIALSRARP